MILHIDIVHIRQGGRKALHRAFEWGATRAQEGEASSDEQVSIGGSRTCVAECL